MLNEPTTRRTFLAGVAVTLSLPVLEHYSFGADDTAPAADEWVATIKPADIAESAFDTSQAAKHKFILGRKDNKIVAIDTRCTHKGGTVKPVGAKLECPLHHANYDFTGAVTKGPAMKNLGRYAIRLNKDGVIEVNASKKVDDTDTSSVLEVPATQPAA